MAPKNSMTDPQIVSKLEILDDHVFPAIDGDLEALKTSQLLWKEAIAELGPALLEESRGEYLRYARSTWQFLSGQATQNPLRLYAVMKIIGLLMGDDA